MNCLTSARYTMVATLMILGRPDVVDGSTTDDGTSLVTTQVRNGITYVLELVQDPDSGAFERHWVPATNLGTDGVVSADDATTVTFPCSARGFTDGGLRVVGTTERWSSRGYIQTIDTIQLKFPANFILGDRDRITNIMDKRTGKVLWLEENGQPSVFEATGTTPIIDMFGVVVENSALLNRAQVQEA